jgi:MoxR-like ATPase
MLSSHRSGEPVDKLQPVIDLAEIARLQHQAREVKVEASLADYLLDIVHATRDSSGIQVGVSTRGTLAYYRAAQSRALVSGRDHVVPDDIKSLATAVLAHRVVPRGMLPGADRSAAEDLITQLVNRIRVPI